MSFDQVADRYDETRGGVDRGRRLAGIVGPWLAPGRTVEVGVGTGLIATALRAGGHDVVGIDLSPAMLAHAYRRMGARVAVGDARGLPLRAGSCDNVLFVAALHAIRDVRAAFAEAARVLRPGGRVVVLAAPDDDAPPPGDDVYISLLAELPPHRRVVPPAVVGDAAAAVGLRPVASEPVLVGPIPQSPNQVADDIETRTWSNLWNVDGVVWARTVEPVIARLRAMPHPDEPRERPFAMHLSVFER